MREEGGFFWPDLDTQASKAAFAEVPLIDRWGLLGLRECVQAGGQVGVYPKALARMFETVYTFEPDWENWACMMANRMPENVIAQQAALMDKPGGVSLYRVADNAGAHYVLGEGQIPAVTIDSLGLTRCDLIQLDIEGAELRALQGAVETLERCHPMLVIEVKSHGQRFGYDKGHLYEWLSKRGYRQTAKVHRDEVWKWLSSG